ncbi:Aste57867_13910 [Aphanomyces stellatus]|uniref:Aste57867_13910 protein n=1 Tax=Aphanomyces stellatus TaxID=120398 RepID=A0A485KZX3_9STRA|nr:hypothetical protein As57867_013859 [Aphanomyces stellatus]VFT90741.1 Aste57867_13910 [Aphanomyces stellatus]
MPMLYVAPGGFFTVSIQIRGGRNRVWPAVARGDVDGPTVDQEVAYWGTHGITSFTLQYLNYWQSGISETFVVVNALGIQDEVSLKGIARTDEGWTTTNMYWMPINDIATLAGVNRCLIRSATNAFCNPPAVSIEDQLGHMDSNGNYVN